MQTAIRFQSVAEDRDKAKPGNCIRLHQALTRTSRLGAGVADLKLGFRSQWSDAPDRDRVRIFVACLGAGNAASLPLAVSSGVVRDRLERDIGAWAGHAVSLGDAPSLDFWPTPTIKLDNVVIQPVDLRSHGDPIMRADSIVANFNLFLSGARRTELSRSSG
jgi:hypothetical protein